MLAEHIADKAYRIRAIQEAKAQAQKGAFISQESIENWVESIGSKNELPMPEPDVFSKTWWQWK